MNRVEMIDYIAKNLQLTHAEAEMAINASLRNFMRRQESEKFGKVEINPQLNDSSGQIQRNKTMSDFKLKRVDL